MQKWEYIVQQFKSPSELSTLLNKLGDDGWELVTLLAEGAGIHSQVVAKRTKDKAWSQPSSSSPA